MALAAIMTSPEFAEVCFLVAVILFVVVAVFEAVRQNVPSALVATGLAFVALAWLAL